MNLKQRYDFDPFLEEISKLIPDEAIDTIFPRGFTKRKGRPEIFKTSQLFRVHVVAMLKQIQSNGPKNHKINPYIPLVPNVHEGRYIEELPPAFRITFQKQKASSDGIKKRPPI
jgi:hypothetical protein